MTTRNLDLMFSPRSVALIGASPEKGSVGETLVRNLTAAEFAGPVFFINPKYDTISGRRCYANVKALPEAPDLAVIATPPATVPLLISEIGERGTRAAVVITAGLSEQKLACLQAAHPYCLRLLGPNVLGLMLPHIGLNASFAHRAAPRGDLAFLSQSGALITAVVDWAAGRSIGFSHVVSLGDMADVDFGDMLDYLAGDITSRAILLYMEALTHAPKFISAARRAARVKPVVVVKSGRHQASAKAALSHTGALAGSDAAYDAAFRRTGLLRVNSLPDLFAAAEMLTHSPPLSGERLMILTNGGGAGILAIDELITAGGSLATLSDGTRQRLDAVLPPIWSRANPVDIIGDAGPQRYDSALSTLLASPDSDAILVIQCPTALASSEENARVVIKAVEQANRNAKPKQAVLSCWLGDDAALTARQLFSEAAIPSFETPSDAIAGFMQLVRHRRAQSELAATPPSGPKPISDMRAAAQRIIKPALDAKRPVLTSVEAKSVLRAAGIPIAETLIAPSAGDVKALADRLLKTNSAVVVKILSRDISHKSDVGGVKLDLETAEEASRVAGEMEARVKRLRPDAVIDGYMVEPMIKRPNAHEVIIGMSEDSTFGPMMLFGAGGVAVEVIADSALALPPLDLLLAHNLISQTRICKMLQGYRDRPPSDMKALADALVRISQLAVDIPEIRELDVNPLLVDENGIIALDARMRVDDPVLRPRRPLAIRPYPVQWEKTISLPSIGGIEVRPVRPEDEQLYRPFFARVTEGDVRLRFFTPKTDLSHKFLARLTQIDYAREMAFVAISKDTRELLGVVRLILNSDLTSGEYAILVRSDLQGKGLGWELMSHLIDYAQKEGITEITGSILTENTTMLAMARKLGFKFSTSIQDVGVHYARLNLNRSSSSEAPGNKARAS